MAEAAGSSLSHAFVLSLEEVGDLLHDVLFVNQIVLLLQNQPELLEDLSEYLEALLLDLFLAALLSGLDALDQLWANCSDHVLGCALFQLLNSRFDGQRVDIPDFLGAFV